MSEFKTYTYSGPVVIFDRCVGMWSGKTQAVSEKKARSNLMFQVKADLLKLAPNARISLPGKIKCIEGD